MSSKSFNDFASGIAAIFGICATVISGITSYQNDKLDTKLSELEKDFKMASLVGSLVKNLSSPELEKDLALIALKDSLTKTNLDDKQQNIYLLFDIAYRISDHAILEFSDRYEQGQLKPKQYHNDIQRLLSDLSIALEILGVEPETQKTKLITSLYEEMNNDELVEEMTRKQNKITEKVFNLKDQMTKGEGEGENTLKSGANGSLVIFSTDPALSINEPISAEYEVKIANDWIKTNTFQTGTEPKVVVFQRGNLFSTGIEFPDQQAKQYLEKIKSTLNRNSAFITSSEQFCKFDKVKPMSIGQGNIYKYNLYECD